MAFILGNGFSQEICINSLIQHLHCKFHSLLLNNRLPQVALNILRVLECYYQSQSNVNTLNFQTFIKSDIIYLDLFFSVKAVETT
jgi:hypothetical protein